MVHSVMIILTVLCVVHCYLFLFPYCLSLERGFCGKVNDVMCFNYNNRLLCYVAVGLWGFKLLPIFCHRLRRMRMCSIVLFKIFNRY